MDEATYNEKLANGEIKTVDIEKDPVLEPKIPSPTSDNQDISKYIPFLEKLRQILEHVAEVPTDIPQGGILSQFRFYLSAGVYRFYVNINNVWNKAFDSAWSFLTSTQLTDLTDGGATTLHKHDHGGQDGLSDDDHPQYYGSGLREPDHGALGGLSDNDHPQYIKKDGTTADISADIPLNTNKLTGVKDPTAAQDAATKNYVDTAGGIISKTFGETVAARKAVYVSTGGLAEAKEVSLESGTSGGYDAYGTQYFGQAFVSLRAIKITKIGFYLKKFGSPGGNVNYSLQLAPLGKPNGVELAGGVLVAAGSVTTSYVWYEATLASPVTVPVNTTYAIYFTCPSGDSSNYIEAAAGGSYSGGNAVMSADGGSSWNVQSSDMQFRIYGTLMPGYVYMTDASFNDERTTAFIGFTIAAVNAGDAGNIRAEGILTGFTGLTEFSTYYLSDTEGEIAVTPGTYSFPIGKAISTTAITIVQPFLVADYGLTSVLAASATLRNSNNDEKTTQSTSYVKLKEILLNEDLSACRIYFTMKCTTYGDTYAYAKIYKNGVAIGTEQSSRTTDGWVTKTEDFTGFVAGDLIQVYVKVNNAAETGRVKDFQFHYSKSITAFSVLTLDTALPTNFVASVTNQDP